MSCRIVLCQYFASALIFYVLFLPIVPGLSGSAEPCVNYRGRTEDVTLEMGRCNSKADNDTKLHELLPLKDVVHSPEELILLTPFYPSQRLMLWL